MYTLNISFKVDNSISDDWIDWMFDVWLPELTKGSDKTTYRLHSLIGHDDPHGKTFVLQVYFPTSDDINKHVAERQSGLSRTMTERWGEKALFFHTVLREIKN